MLSSSRQAFSQKGCRSLASAAASSARKAAYPEPPVLPSQPGSLEGKIVWMVGGAGLIGTGLARGYLHAGATVICNSRYDARLQRLSEDLGHPERLIAFRGSMLPDQSEQTVNAVMELTAGKLDHVVTHSAVRWWGGDNRDGDETNLLVNSGVRGSLFDMSMEDFTHQAMMLPQMHFATARLLFPRLQQVPNSTYIFVTGGIGERSPIGQINAKAVWGLAAAMRAEGRVGVNLGVNVEEVRVGLRFNRSAEERRADPRDEPLSHDIGHICAGIAAAPAESLRCELHKLDSADDVAATKQRFPVLNESS
jgi:NAD(P)-dependent dehydrogenase (short-subunit alcohol dehydrogenase family)